MNPVNTKPYNLPEDATWLITGCSSGIGRALAILIASKPTHRLIATARDPSTLSYLPDDNPNILKLALDVTSVTSIDAAFASAAKHFGPSFHLDITVNNAGYSLSGDTESATEEETHMEMETLFFGTARITTRAITNMRTHPTSRGGIIFNISSLAGLVGFPGHSYYHASKFAVEGWSESVARELHPDWNINISILEPSAVQTSFEHSKVHTIPHPAYTSPDMPSRILEKYVNMGLKMGMGTDVDVFAEAVYKLADQKGGKVPLRQPLGDVAWKMGKGRWETLLQEWDGLKEVAFMGKE